MAETMATPLIGSGGAALGDWGIGSVNFGQGLGVMGALTGAMGSISSGNAQAAAAEQNAQMMRLQAEQMQQQGQAQAQLQDQENRRRLGQVSASYGASGVDVAQGSPLAVMSDQATQGELARQLLLWKANSGAANLKAQADYEADAASGYSTRGITGAGGTLLTSAANLFGKSGSTLKTGVL